MTLICPKSLIMPVYTKINFMVVETGDNRTNTTSTISKSAKFIIPYPRQLRRGNVFVEIDHW